MSEGAERVDRVVELEPRGEQLERFGEVAVGYLALDRVQSVADDGNAQAPELTAQLVGATGPRGQPV